MTALRRRALLAVTLVLAGCRGSCSRSSGVEPSRTSVTVVPAPSTVTDAGAVTAPPAGREAIEATETRILCAGQDEGETASERSARACTFGGVVRALRPDAFRRERATRIVLGSEATPPTCALDRLRGELQMGGAPSFKAAEILVTLEPGLDLSISPGDVVCGSVRAFPRDGSVDFDVANDGLVAGPEGQVLLAFSRGVPRDGSPLPGWKFVFGERRTSARPGIDVFDQFDMKVEHGGSSARLAREGGFVSVGASDGLYRVRARGSRANGPLSDRYKVREKSRYDFVIARSVGE